MRAVRQAVEKLFADAARDPLLGALAWIAAIMLMIVGALAALMAMQP